MTVYEKALNTANIQGLANQIHSLSFTHLPPESQDLMVNDSELFAKSESKAIFTLIAQFALAGYAVHIEQSGGYCVSNYVLSHDCENYSKLKEFACQLGVT